MPDRAKAGEARTRNTAEGHAHEWNLGVQTTGTHRETIFRRTERENKRRSAIHDRWSRKAETGRYGRAGTPGGSRSELIVFKTDFSFSTCFAVSERVSATNSAFECASG